MRTERQACLMVTLTGRTGLRMATVFTGRPTRPRINSMRPVRAPSRPTNLKSNREPVPVSDQHVFSTTPRGGGIHTNTNSYATNHFLHFFILFLLLLPLNLTESTVLLGLAELLHHTFHHINLKLIN